MHVALLVGLDSTAFHVHLSGGQLVERTVASRRDDACGPEGSATLMNPCLARAKSKSAGFVSRRRCTSFSINLDPQANMSQALMGEDGYRRFLDDNSP